MKKIFLISLAIFYLVSSSGIVVCLDKCREFFQSLTADTTLTHGCCQQKHDNSVSNEGCQKGCCKGGKCMLKLQTSQQLVAKHEWSAKVLNTAIILNNGHFFYQAPVLAYRVLILPDYHAPPSRYKNPLYLHYRALLI